MDNEVAENLVNELGKHSGIIRPDKDFFLNILVPTKIPESSRFYEILPDSKQLLEETSQYHYLSLRRVLRNKNAKNYQLSKLKSIYEAIASEFGIYSSEVLDRKIRTNKDLINMMAECEHPFSLLCKFQTWDFGNTEGRLFSITKPILVIPNVKDTSKILNWEGKNTDYKEEIRILGMFPIQKRIKPQEYFTA